MTMEFKEAGLDLANLSNPPKDRNYHSNRGSQYCAYDCHGIPGTRY